MKQTMEQLELTFPACASEEKILITLHVALGLGLDPTSISHIE